MERFDINKELKNLEGLSVRAKCSALDDLCCTLREAISDISNAKNEILEEYKRSCRKKFIDEINSEIKVITAKPKAHAFKNEMCFPLTKTKCELKKHPNSKFECFFNDFNRTKTSLFLPFPSKLIQDNLVCVLELQE